MAARCPPRSKPQKSMPCDPGYATQGALGSIVRQANAPIIEELGERVPPPQYVETRLGRIVVARQLADLDG